MTALNLSDRSWSVGVGVRNGTIREGLGRESGVCIQQNNWSFCNHHLTAVIITTTITTTATTITPTATTIMTTTTPITTTITTTANTMITTIKITTSTTTITSTIN